MTRPAPQDGYVLVATLGVMLVLSGLIASSSLLAHSALRGARTDDAMERLDVLLRGGLEMTAYQLFVLKVPIAAVDGRAIRVGGGSVTARITDEGARIDVNAADPALLTGALQSGGLDRSTVAEIMERVGVARGTTRPQAGQIPHPAGSLEAPGGGGSGSAAAAGPGGARGVDTERARPMGAPDDVAPPTRTGFRSVAEFLAFAGLGRADAEGLSDLLTVRNPDGKLNVMTASRRALLAMPGLSVAKVDNFLADRRSAARRSDLAALKAALDAQKTFVKFEGGPCYRVRLASRDEQRREAFRDAVIAAGAGTGDPFFVLDWE